MKKILLALSCLALLAPMFLVAITSSAPYPYDPWSDLDSDGNIDIFDVVKMAGSYDTTGDPTKDVNVTNWSASQPVTVKYAWNDGWDGFLVPVGDWHPFYVYNTEGYKEINVGIDATYDCNVRVLWHIGIGMFEVDTYGVTGGIPLVKHYSVQGDYFMIFVYNLGPMDNYLYFDWYITA